MTRTPPLRFLPDLNMPLRDALRGVASLAEATEDMLEPAVQLMPEPLRSRFHSALTGLEQAGRRLVHTPTDAEEINTAAAFITGQGEGRSAAQICAKTIVHAWEHLAEAGVGHRHLISETVMAETLSRLAQPAQGVPFAAQALRALRASSAIGRLPGLARGTTAQEDAETDMALVAILTWLVSSRAETVAEEEKLLDLSIALIRALEPEARHALAADNAADLAAFLSDASAHL